MSTAPPPPGAAPPPEWWDGTRWRSDVPPPPGAVSRAGPSVAAGPWSGPALRMPLPPWLRAARGIVVIQGVFGLIAAIGIAANPTALGLSGGTSAAVWTAVGVQLVVSVLLLAFAFGLRGLSRAARIGITAIEVLNVLGDFLAGTVYAIVGLVLSGLVIYGLWAPRSVKEAFAAAEARRAQRP